MMLCNRNNGSVSKQTDSSDSVRFLKTLTVVIIKKRFAKQENLSLPLFYGF